MDKSQQCNVMYDLRAKSLAKIAQIWMTQLKKKYSPFLTKLYLGFKPNIGESGSHLEVCYQGEFQTSDT